MKRILLIGLVSVHIGRVEYGDIGNYYIVGTTKLKSFLVVEEITKKILCLPIYPGLENKTIEIIIEIILSQECLVQKL